MTIAHAADQGLPHVGVSACESSLYNDVGIGEQVLYMPIVHPNMNGCNIGYGLDGTVDATGLSNRQMDASNRQNAAIYQQEGGE